MAKPKKQSSERVKPQAKDARASRVVPKKTLTEKREPEAKTEDLGSSAPYDLFLKQLALMPIRQDALKGTGLTAQDIRDRSEADPNFARKLAQAWDLGIDVAEDAAFKRGILGWEEPVFTKDGGLSGYVTRYDGGLLKEVLKANRGKYRGEDTGRSRGVSEETQRGVAKVFEEARSLP